MKCTGRDGSSIPPSFTADYSATDPFFQNLQPPDAKTVAANAATVVKSLGSFTLLAISPREIIVFATQPAGNAATTPNPSQLNAVLLSFIQPSSGIFSIELHIPHASLFHGSLATQLTNLGYSQFTITAIGGDRIRVISTGPPTKQVWEAFIADIRRTAQNITTEPPVYKLYAADAADAKALVPNATAAPASNQSTGGKNNNDAGSDTNTSNSGKNTGKNSDDDANESDDSSTSEKSSGSKKKTKSTSGKKSENKKKSADKSANSGDSQIEASDKSENDSSTAETGSKSQSAAPAAMSVAAGSATPVETDTLTFDESKFLDDAAVTEKKRLLAAIDLPRPQMIVNAWVLQNSSRDPRKSTAVETLVQSAVREHNEAIQMALYTGWNYLKIQIASGNYFSQPFYRYITQRVVFDPTPEPYSLFNDEQSETLNADKSLSNPAIGSVDPHLDGSLDRYGICDSRRYCLGYTTIFQPLQPRFIDLLLALIAADDPVSEMNKAVNAAECLAGSPTPCLPYPFSAGEDASKRLRIARATTDLLEFKSITNSGTLHEDQLQKYQACERADQYGILYALHADPADTSRPPVPRLFLECFRRAAMLLLRKHGDSIFDDPSGPSPVGELRAAVADFLFFYKSSQAYPHEFNPYDLTMSADAFDTAMNPLVEAFNRDLNAYQDYLRLWIDRAISEERLVSSRNDFFNGGTITVRSVSGYPSNVQTSSTSFLDASEAPTLSSLFNSVTGAKPSGGTSSSQAAATPNVLNNLSFNEAQVIAGALAAYQPQEMKVSRQLNLNFTPRSLIGANASQLTVTLKADEPAAPSYWPNNSGASAAEADSSYIAQHDTTTTVRIDSIKLFQLSAFTAVLQKGRPLFPLLPPGVTLPYIGTLAGIPLPAAKEYHNSIAILGAIVVPTATDLAVGLRFLSDRIVDRNFVQDSCVWPFPGVSSAINRPHANYPPTMAHIKPCTVHHAVSINDFAGQPVREYNRMMVYCLAHEGQSAEPNSADTQAGGENPCSNLTYEDVLHDSY